VAATDGFWGKFRHWRRRRPFWGSLIMLIAGLELLYTANADLGDLKVHIGPQGFLSYVVPLVIILCALLAAFTPAQRLFYGIVGLLASLYSFIGLNLGGFFLGMLLGILGGALVIAWGPPKRRPGTPLAGPPTGEPTDHHEDGPVDVGDDIFNERPDIDETQQIEIAGHDDRPHEPAGPGGPASPPGPAAPAGSPGPRGAAGSPGPAGSPGSAGTPVRPASQGAAPEEPPTAGAPRAAGLQRLARNPRAMVLALVPVAVTATIIAAGSTLPASADDECPAGLPSIATTTTSPAAADPAKKSAAAAKTTEAAAEKTTAGKKPKAEKRVPAGKSAGKEDGESKRGRKKGKKSVETSRPHLSSSKWREWSSSEGDCGGLQLVQQWRSWRAGVGSPGDDGARRWSGGDDARGWADGHGARRWSGGDGAGWACGHCARGWACGHCALSTVGFSGPQADGPSRKRVIRIGKQKIVPHCSLNCAHTCL